MPFLGRLAAERTDLAEDEVAWLRALISDWSLVADLALSDLVLWLPTWNDAGCVAAAQVRPATGPTSIPDDLVGTFLAKGRSRALDRAAASGQPHTVRAASAPLLPAEAEAIPVRRRGRVIGFIERRLAPTTRAVGRLEQVYLASADDLLAMIGAGTFPLSDAISRGGVPPRVGDGLIRLNAEGRVEFASPNAQSAFRRLGLAVQVEGADLAAAAARLTHRPGPVDEALSMVAAGRVGGQAEIENASATVALQSIPLSPAGVRRGALVLVQDITDLRQRDRALVSKDATIREVHHRVKNNLQTVAALLRLQARRTDHPDAREALGEATRRVAAIALVHETLAGAIGGDGEVDFDDVVDRLLSAVVDTAHPVAEVTVSRQGSGGLVPALVATPLSVALSELLHNAIEHGVGGRPTVAVTVTLARDASGDALTASVHDDGLGMDASAPEGLGRQIVRTLMEDELGGTLVYDRPESGGTRATVQVSTARRSDESTE